MTTLREERLENGLRIVFVDESNRYFGDYHRICITAEIHCQVSDLPVSGPEEQVLQARALEKFGATLTVFKKIERMGVATADVDSARTGMIDDFFAHAASYMSRPGYPLLLVKAELNKKPVSRFYV